MTKKLLADSLNVTAEVLLKAFAALFVVQGYIFQLSRDYYTAFVLYVAALFFWWLPSHTSELLKLAAGKARRR